ncbi:lysophospholipid acyltransferase family protein [Salipiger sp. 1_MG-2023]|uniref:lysophospholipid acyltransferase family protein n=1 Tax=Salipiger sp. 1_MG-2023 TaxID=3062665 RepID=UPI0026E23EF7|nr:lysophospholipid acyltransferase family protein [Salipiger sp. 1_MG-2023]MDO6587637.1 lysophospholipid acyltransferase family protein [Salipiger sp. 1_MG-2023]
MSPTWRGEPPKDTPPGPGGWALALLRGLALTGVLLVGVCITLPLRLLEIVGFGGRRRVTPYVTQYACRAAMGVLGIRVESRGPQMSGAGSYVANHASWLDIFVLNAHRNLCFVSKSEVAGWPGIGLLAKLTGTLFIARDPRAALEQRKLFERRLLQRDRLLFFPEGTSTDGQRVLPFKSTLFSAFYADALRHEMQLQAVTVIYEAPPGADPRFYGWWGDMTFGGHLLKMLGTWRQGRVRLVYHPPVRVDDHPNRKSLAAQLERQVRSAHPCGQVVI